jgi:glycosyltransferase involved in cell wall biosynthesis
VCGGREGLVTAADDEAALADALTTLAKDETLRRKLGGAAAEQARQFAPASAFQAWDDALWPRA